MFGATTNYPFNFANRNGIPMLESTSVETTTTNVIVNIPNRAFRFLNGTGLILFRLNTEIADGTLPILFSSNDFTQPLTLGVDTGSGTLATAVCTDRGEILYLSEVEFPDTI